MSAPTFASNQFSEIAATAGTLVELLSEALSLCSDSGSSADLVAAARAVAGQIGYVADRALIVSGEAPHRGGAEDWLLSPCARGAG